MRSLNRINLIGHTGKGCDYKNEGVEMAKFSVATSHRQKDKTGEWIDVTQWHNIVLFGKSANAAKEYLYTGALVHVSGRLNTRKYTAKDGSEKLAVEIVANEFNMLSKKDKEEKPESLQKEVDVFDENNVNF